MSQHSQRTQSGPATASIVVGWVMSLLSAVGAWYVISDPVWDTRAVTAKVMSVCLTALVWCYELGLMVERALVRDRAVREAVREAERADRARSDEREMTTWELGVLGRNAEQWTGRKPEPALYLLPDADEVAQDRVVVPLPPREPVDMESWRQEPVYDDHDGYGPVPYRSDVDGDLYFPIPYDDCDGSCGDRSCLTYVERIRRSLHSDEATEAMIRIGDDDQPEPGYQATQS